MQAALAWQLQAEVFNMCGEGRRAEVAARRGLDALAGHAAPEVHANLLADLGAAFWAQDRGVEARDALEEAVRRLEPLGETEALASNLSSLAVVLDHQDRHREAEGYHRRACALLERLGDTANLLVALRNLSVCLSDLGRVREALGLLERARTLEGNAEGLWSSPTGHALLAFAYADLGEYSAALASFAQARALGERPHVWLPAYYRACEAEVWLTLGEVERARPLLSAALDVPEMPDTFRLRALLSLARLEVSRGEDGTDLLETARALLDEGGGGRPLWRARYLLARAEASTPLEALRYAQGALDVARTHELGQYELTAELRVTRALLTLGRHADALTHAERAARLLEHVTAADMTRGEALLIVHDARRSNGRADAAATLEDARRWLRDTAERHVPEGARERFVRAHPVHRALTNGATNANG
ncbi:tetratricopeptide repeat protein [Deinococcus pimensis]|uniref:tetratricopeptide repeat protein n=1 Tax=Deinococcus pimensis TaxID=309888 RepID=UPI000486F258|nr:tetratricopeptide repeat protein [Deinococcus pimensis]